MEPHVRIGVQPSEATPETLEPHPHSTIDERNLWKNNKQLSIPPMMEENATVSRSGDAELEEIKIDQENHADMDTSVAGPSFGGERGSPKLKENAEIVPAPEPMDPCEPLSHLKLKGPADIGSTSGDFYEPVSSDKYNFSGGFQSDAERIELYRLVASGDMESFDKLVDRPITIPQLSPQNNSALHVAAQYKQAKMAKKIIELAPQLVNSTNMNGDLPLHIAARVGCKDTSDFLLEQKVMNENITNKQGDTPLHDAVRGAHLEVVKSLVEKYPSWTRAENGVGESPLFLAVDKWHFDIAEVIFPKYDCSIRGRDSMNVLHAAVIRLGPGKLLPNILTILLD